MLFMLLDLQQPPVFYIMPLTVSTKSQKIKSHFFKKLSYA